MDNKYKQIGRNDLTDIAGCFFENRGVNYKEYKSLDQSCVIPYSNLDNINEAVRLLQENAENKIHIVVDCDADGVTSAAIMYRYIKEVYGNTPTYSLHTGKQHGLSDDIQIPEDTDLLIIPDAGTNDVEQCKALSEKGVKILILDHHLKEVENPYAVIVNNQISENYTNKEFCGAGVVYKFLKAVDEDEWIEKADDYLDLVALGNISDVMDMRSYETRYLTQLGIENIKSRALKAFIKAQERSLDRKIDIISIAFYISPLINAVCRVGTAEDKEILFRAFADDYEEFSYKPKKAEPGTIENIYDRAARLAKNAKARQSKAVDKIVVDLKQQVEDYGINKNPIMFVKADEKIASEFTGLAAMKLADFYKKPCVILRKSDEVYRGSARNFDFSPFENLKETLEKTELFERCAGHENSFGVFIKPENINMVIKNLKEEYGNIKWSIPIDFCLSDDELNISVVRDIDSLKKYFATGLKEPMLLIENVRLIKSQCQVMGKDESTWKFTREDNIEYIKFKSSENNPVLDWLKSDDENDMYITVFGKAGFNAFGGLLTPQITITDYKVIKNTRKEDKM